jgi:nitroimidazol reductase NimA-like FMN-containing flavoprotein (pyridoxamine 5'-phosphate oxidase superfamily)
MSSNKMTHEDVESLFRESYTTVFCSHNGDGTIHAAPIWYNYRDGVFYFVSIKKSKRVENLRRNSKVSLSFLDQGTKVGDEGEAQSKCALVYGTAELGFEPDEGYDKYVQWVWGKYYKDRDSKFDPKTQITLRVVPNKIVHFYP